MPEPLLQLSDVHAAYGEVEVLRGIDLTVGEGEVVVLLGANGAGKTTTLRAICGMVGMRGSTMATTTAPATMPQASGGRRRGAPCGGCAQ